MEGFLEETHVSLEKRGLQRDPHFPELRAPSRRKVNSKKLRRSLVRCEGSGKGMTLGTSTSLGVTPEHQKEMTVPAEERSRWSLSSSLLQVSQWLRDQSPDQCCLQYRATAYPDNSCPVGLIPGEWTILGKLEPGRVNNAKEGCCLWWKRPRGHYSECLCVFVERPTDGWEDIWILTQSYHTGAPLSN